MITLPDECLYETLNDLKDDYKSLFSCLTVNHQWCRNVVPILWREPDLFKSKELVRTCLSLLNIEEQTLLAPFGITLSNNPKPLFEYAVYIKVIKFHTYEGISCWLIDEGYQNTVQITRKIQYLLIKKFLQTSQALKDFYCNYKFVNLLTDLLNNFANLTSLTLLNDMEVSDDWESLAKALHKNTTLTDLSIEGCQLNSNVGIAVADALCENNTLTSLNVPVNRLGLEGGRALAKMIHKNSTLTHLDIRSNQIGPLGGKAIVESLYNNSTLIHLNIKDNQIGSDCGKEFAKVLYKNTTLTFLDISNNHLYFDTEDAFAIHSTRIQIILHDYNEEEEEDYGYYYECDCCNNYPDSTSEYDDYADFIDYYSL